MKLTKKHLSNGLWLLLLALILIPQTGRPIKIFVNRLLAFSPAVVNEDKREQLDQLHWNLVSAEGERVNLKDYAGEVILVNLWATWCPPCIAEMPSLQALESDYGDRVKFLFVTQEKPEVVQKFMDNAGFELPVFFPSSSYPSKLESRSIPATYVVDRNGYIVVKKTGSANWNSNKVRNLLDQLLQAQVGS